MKLHRKACFKENFPQSHWVNALLHLQYKKNYKKKNKKRQQQKLLEKTNKPFFFISNPKTQPVSIFTEFQFSNIHTNALLTTQNWCYLLCSLRCTIWHIGITKILLMYAELMTLIFPSHSPFLSTVNSSVLYLEKRVISVSCCGVWKMMINLTIADLYSCFWYILPANV